MKFQQKIKLLSGKETWASEIAFGQYKALIKSIYNTDDEAFIHHSNLLLETNLQKEDYSKLTVIDKILVLLQLKAISVEPDLKLNVKCEETKKEFEYILPLDSLIKNLVLSSCTKTIQQGEFVLETSLIKAKDEQYFVEPNIDQKDTEKLFFNTVVSSIDVIKYKNEIIDFKDISWEERCKLVTRLPAKLSSYIINNISETEKTVSKIKLLSIKSPFTNKTALELPLTTNVPSLVKFIKLVYTDNLTNLYTLTYNLINRAGFTGNYLDSITPIETQVYWIYCQKQMEKESEQSERNSDVPNMARSNSEFT